MIVENNFPVMVFRKDSEYGTSYSIGLNKKNKDGSYTNGYIPIKFKKEVELENQTKIFIKNAFLTFYINKDKKTVPYIMCLEFEKAEFDKPKTNSEIMKEVAEAPEVDVDFQITDDDLPF